ncbi:4Fe-4S dicluster domain-containing protein [bacterium]|nr:4Fe-4S dicluster domain-containing protein [bacterium]
MPRSELRTKTRKQKLSPEELSDTFLSHVYALPDGRKLDLCIQCGTCSGSCPTAYAMDYSPREIFAALRAGMLDRVLFSNTAWMCTSCYICTVRCPQQIKITDIMYELKRLGIKYGYTSPSTRSAAMARIFINITNRLGRNNESELMMRFYMAGRWGDAIKNAWRGAKMFFKGRLPMPISGREVAGLSEMRKIREVLERLEEQKAAEEVKH